MSHPGYDPHNPANWQQPRKSSGTGVVVGVVLGCCCLPILLIVGFGIYFYVQYAPMLSGEKSFMAGMLPDPQVSIGSPLGWQEPLGRSNMMSSSLVSGNFDGQGQAEALVIGMDMPSSSDILKNMRNPQASSYMLQIHQIDPSGQVRTQGSNNMVYFYQCLNWDYGNDGRDEIVSLVNGTGQAEIYDGKLQLLTSLAGGDAFYGNCSADVDGDGIAELVLADTNAGQASVYDCNGQLVSTLAISANGGSAVWGDTDGDGTDEMIITNETGGSAPLVVRRIGQADQPLEVNWPQAGWPIQTADVNGDGVDEIVSSGGGYLNIAPNSFVSLQYPAGYDNSGTCGPLYPVDIDGDGIREIATGGANYSMASALLIFDQTGQCIYYEEFGATVQGKCVITDAAGRDHLFVLTDNRLLLYP